MNGITLIRFIAIIFLATLLYGCAAPRTNTQAAKKEKQTLVFIKESGGVRAAAIADSAIGIAINALIQLAKAGINLEAKNTKQLLYPAYQFACL